MKRISARILCSVMASILMFGSVSTPATAADYSLLTQTEEDGSSSASVEADGYEDLRKQMEDIIEEGKNGSSDSEDAASSESGVDESADESSLEDADTSADDSAESEDTEDITGAEGESDTSSEDISGVPGSDTDDEELTGSDKLADNKKDQDKELLQSGQWTYYLDEDGYAHIAGYGNTEVASLSVPKKLGKYYVTAIEADAFSDLTNLTSISIPFYTRYINEDAFGSDVTIKAYHGTAAATFAEENGYSFTNLSELDFADGVIDLSEIYRAHYSRISDNEFEFDKTEASYLEVGSVFYLAPSDEVVNGDVFRVTDKQDFSDSSVIYVERAIGKDALNSIHIDAENMKPDWNEAVFYFDSDNDGIYEEYTLDDMEQVGDEYMLMSGDAVSEYTLGKSCEIEFQKTLKNSKLLDGGDTDPSVEFEIDLSGKVGLDLSYTTKADIDFITGEITLFEATQKAEATISGSISGSLKTTIPIVTYKVGFPGIVEISCGVNACYDFSGELSIEYSMSSTDGYRIVGDQIQEIQEFDSDFDFEFSAEWKAYIKAYIKVEVANVAELEISLECGLKYEKKESVSSGVEFALSAFDRLGGSLEVELPGTTCKVNGSIDVMNMEKVLKVYLVNKYQVIFNTGKSYAVVPNQTVPDHGYAEEPDTSSFFTDEKGNGVGVEGWYTDPSFKKRWDFEKDKVTRNMVLYAKLTPTHTITLDYSDVGQPSTQFAAVEGTPLIIKGTLKIYDYRFEGWYTNPDHTERWILGILPVPDHDLTLYANYDYEEGYNPWDEEVPENETIVDDGVTYSSEGFKYKVYDSDDGKYAVITGYEGAGGGVVVPTYVDNGKVKVKSIETEALQGNLAITDIRIPNGITIPIGALKKCTNIETIKIEDVKFVSQNGDVSTHLSRLLWDVNEGTNIVPGKYPSLRKVTLTGAITVIPKYSFSYFSQLEEISYPDTVTQIGAEAFRFCSGLKTLPISENITTIGDFAFQYCSGISRIDIPDGVRTISSYAFADCPNVTKIVIPNNEITIESYAFADLTKVKEVVVPNKVTLRPTVFYNCTGLESITIPELRFVNTNGDVSTHLSRLLWDTSEGINIVPGKYPSLRKVTLTGAITAIPDYCFSYWEQLEEINYPDTVTKIGVEAFRFCSGLKTLPISENITTIGDFAFQYCNGISRIDIPDGVRTISSYAFADCSNVTKIVIPNNEITIESYAFAELTNVKEVVVPNKVTLRPTVFYKCTGLESISIPDMRFVNTNGDVSTHLSRLLWDTSEGINIVPGKYPALRKVTLTGAITAIPDYCFSYWEQLEEINYPDTVTKIGVEAFRSCYGLKTLPISENITTIGDYAFSYCNGISRIDIPDGVRTISPYAFAYCSNVTKIVIPNNEITIDSYAFTELTNVKEVVVPDKVTLRPTVFYKCTGLESITIPEMRFVKTNGDVTTALSNLLWSTNVAMNVVPGKYPSLRKVTLSGAITAIPAYSFAYWKQLEEISYPDTVTQIGANAFQYCNGLKRIVLPSGLNSIGSAAFTGCTGLEEILVYSDTLDISGIPYMTDEEGNVITTVYGHADSKAEEYANNNNLPFEDIDENYAPVNYVYNNGQSDTVSFERVGELVCEPDEPSYSGFVFDRWYFDEECTVPWDFDYDLMPACGITLYADWNANESIINNFRYEVIADEVTITGYTGNNGYVTVPEKIKGLPVTKLGNRAFAYDNDVIGITIPKTVEEIAQDCFVESPYLSTITVASGNEFFTSEDGILFDKEKTELILYPAKKQGDSYTVPDTVSSIRCYAFAGSELKEVILNEGLEEIGEMAFASCSMLNCVTLPETVDTFGSFVFWESPKVQVYGPIGNENIEEFIGKELVDYNLYNLTFVSDDSEWAKYRVKAGELVSDYLQETLKAIGKSSYKLAQWIVEGDENNRAWNFATDVMPGSDVTLKADWTCTYSYSVTEDKAQITGIVIDAKDYVLPESIDGYEITGIAGGAFAKDTIETVTVPATITDIADGAFHGDVTIIADADSNAAAYAENNGLDFMARKYPVVFESNGGTAVSTRYYAKGSKITTVPKPTKDNNVFSAWCSNTFLTAKWDFEKDVMPGEGITLYARWNKIDENKEDDVFSYENDENKVTITGYTGKSSYVEIPSTINGVTVTAIGEYAFAFNETAANVIIPDTVTSIDAKAFYNCNSLEKITFGRNVETIGASAFAGCGSLNKVDLSGTKVTTVPDSCFMQAVNLYYVTLPGSITEIGDSSFAGCTYLQAIELPSALESLGRHAFYNDKMIEELTVPASVVSVGEGFADGCSSLKEIKTSGDGKYKAHDGILYTGNTLVRCPEDYEGDVFIPDDTVIIGKGAFYHCAGIISVTLGKAVNTIGTSAFNGCKNLESFHFTAENRVTGISDSMFYGCSSLVSIVLPEQVRTIGKSAFTNCAGLTALRVGEEVTSIGSGAFFGDVNLTIQCYADSAIDKYAAIDKSLRLEYIADKALTPKAPEAESVVNTTITLKATEGYEYKMNEGEWQTSNVFAGLEPVTAYTFYQRVAESPYVHESNSSEGAVIVSGKNKGRSVKTPAIKTVTSSSVTVAALAGCEYSIDGVNFQAEPELTNLRANTQYTVYQRAAETADCDAGEAAGVSFTTLVHTGSCTVTFNLNGGTLEGYEGNTFTAVYENGDLVTDPGVPVLKGYNFDGWFYGDEKFNFKTPIDNDVVLVAGWTVRQQVKKPFANIDGSTPVERKTKVTLSTETLDARIYYTLDGSEPTMNSTPYDGPITVVTDVTIKAIAVKDGSADSDVMTLVIAVKPDESDIGDVAMEDIPVSEDPGQAMEERIPDRLWVAGFEKEMPYTGSAVTQNIRVYNHKSLLTEKNDYKLTYKNNTKAGTATLTITGTGSFNGSLKLDFEITALDIADNEAFSAEDVFASYNKKAQKPSTVLLHGTKKLSSGTDYDASWINEKGEANKGITEAGEYEITLTGKGNYRGTRKLTFHVTESTLISKTTLKTIKAQEYTGEAVHPEIILTDKKYTLIEGTDYYINWPSDCTSVGNVTLTVEGMGKYAGSRTATFAIKGTALKSAAVSGIASSYGYEGDAIEPAGPSDDNNNYGTALLTVTDSKTKVKTNLVKGRDYTVSYKNNEKAGTATAVFTGTGRYTGTVSKTFKIAAYSLAKDVDNITVVYDKSVSYVKNGVKPAVCVYFRGIELTEGTDYTVTYSNNNAVTTDSTKKLPTISIKGKGSFTGSYKALNFSITKQDIAGMIISVPDKVYVNKAKAFMSTPVITDASNPSAKLVAGKDYNKTVTYRYEEDVQVTQVVNKISTVIDRKKGDIVENADILPVGAVVRAEVTGMGSYEGTLSGCYKIMQTDISKATVKVADQSYTGKAIEPGKDQITSIKIGKTELTRDDYEIVEYSNNEKAGTATMIIRGRGIYGGTKKVTFKIVKRSF
jgi:hypothetical protein